MERIKPNTRDGSAMVRDGYFEPERVFPAPAADVLDGDLDDRALEMLELFTWVFRVAHHDRSQVGLDWAILQRWYRVGDSREKRNRIYSALAYLVSEGYLREGTATPVPAHPALQSDHFYPTRKALEIVDRRQSPMAKKLWFEIADRQGGLAALVAAVVSAGIAVGFKFLF